MAYKFKKLIYIIKLIQPLTQTALLAESIYITERSTNPEQVGTS